MHACADPVRTDDTAALATTMEDLTPAERDRRIALAGDKIIDLRAVLAREQRLNRGHEL